LVFEGAVCMALLACTRSAILPALPEGRRAGFNPKRSCDLRTDLLRIEHSPVHVGEPAARRLR
jgi:hypothetical protein